MKIKLTVILLLGCVGIFYGQNLHTHANAASIENEANTTAGWTSSSAISASTDTAVDGNLSILSVSTGLSGRLMSYTFTAVVGQVYEISIWAREGDQGNQPAFANWVGFNGFSTTVISGTNWAEYTWTLTATDTNPVIRVYCSPYSGAVVGDNLYIDAVSIVPQDAESPTAPGNLTSNNTTGNSTNLSWNASTDNVGVTDYEVFQDGVSIGLSGGATTFNVTSLVPNTSYDFTVFARDAAGNVSPSSNVHSVTTTGVPDTEAPTSPGNLSSNNTTSNSTNLSWNASTDNVGVTDYEVFQDGVSIGLSGGATTFNVTSLAPSTSYDFTVFARDAAGNVSSSSNVHSVTTTGAPDTEAPTAPGNLTSNNTTSNSTNLSWNASTDNIGVTDYEVFQDGVSIGLSGGATTFNVTSLAPNTSYDFTVFARDAAGNVSPSSNVRSVTTLNGQFTDYTSDNANLPTVDWTARDLFADRNIGIGTTNTRGFRLAVAGDILSEEVRVALQGNWPDYVFSDTYDLIDLKELENYIKKHKHLINIPSAGEVEKNGIKLGDISGKLLEKIEELTLYTIRQQKELDSVREQNSTLLKRLQAIEKQLEEKANKDN
ncbi:fibronectin type III domain-containing protein [Zhouia spongiae]|uniref:Fibronectin type III domain-containing protein n=1 Tax=Zhouia spongiae TaxID=2202721 RepID=A0ABY3YKW8_9FLAO|nr:fibronectin type III domain-containing protein [Zhouia spongiae]UNY98405.1 fibronectin type III domain-containing protein [Zhouia spongiae]